MELSSLLASYAGEGFGVLLVLLTLIQIAPIKLNPWSFIAKRIGRAINGEVLAKVDQLSNDLKNLREVCDEREADSCRSRILHFNDEILHEVRHTKEHFDQILVDISKYEGYCDTHRDYRNNVAHLAIDNVKRTYKKCGEEGTFL